VERWEHRREILNLMGKYGQTYMLKQEGSIFEAFWSQQEDRVSLGVNEGWFVGREHVKDYYAALGEEIAVSSDLMQKAFPEKLGGMSKEELYGVGLISYKPFNSGVVEIAEDCKTAKGLWYCNGGYAKTTTAGPVSFWEWCVYAADFVWEEGKWRIWHMQHLQDVDTPTGHSWGEPFNLEEMFPAVPEFEAMAQVRKAIPNVPVKLRELYHTDRPFSPLPEPPVPYETFSKTFSYGYEEV